MYSTGGVHFSNVLKREDVTAVATQVAVWRVTFLIRLRHNYVQFPVSHVTDRHVFFFSFLMLSTAR
jgi:hypothetical protein